MSFAAASSVHFIAHKGFSAKAPENSASAFLAAQKAGFKSVECDLQVTFDGEIVLIHDETLELYTSLQKRVAQFRLSELLEMDFGSWFDPKFKGERVLSLDSALEFLQSFEKIYLDAKPSLLWKPATLQHLLKCLHKAQIFERSRVCSFDPNLLERLEQMEPQLAQGYSVETSAEYTEVCRRQENAHTTLPVLLIDHTLLRPDLQWTQDVLEKFQPILWTIDDPEEVRHFAQLGFETFVTNALTPGSLGTKGKKN